MAFYMTPANINMSNTQKPEKCTLEPTTTGTTVVGVQYDGGVLLGSDTLISFGGNLRFYNQQLIKQISHNSLLTASGEYSDLQELERILKAEDTKSFHPDPETKKSKLSPFNYGKFLAKTNYHWRNEYNPKWTNCLLAGRQEGKNFLGNIDMYGAYSEKQCIAVGFGKYFADPIFEKEVYDPNTNQYVLPSYEKALELIKTIYRVCFSQDARQSDVIQLAKVDDNGVQYLPQYKVKCEWQFNNAINFNNEKLVKN